MDIQGTSRERRAYLLAGVGSAVVLSALWVVLLLTRTVPDSALAGIAVSIGISALLAAAIAKSRIHCGH
ncbi:hypothetical protein [Streptacidiphilus carbonis]|uniref:hypothetical protein n=1 Tax=Streptacidiphilus carbonis TaxID=105422 RepID=UPI00126A2AE3|nr:hypothetical protein [Streptacidiphilus carbonis]